jgi:hypothetical protein
VIPNNHELSVHEIERLISGFSPISTIGVALQMTRGTVGEKREWRRGECDVNVKPPSSGHFLAFIVVGVFITLARVVV